MARAVHELHHRDADAFEKKGRICGVVRLSAWWNWVGVSASAVSDAQLGICVRRAGRREPEKELSHQLEAQSHAAQTVCGCLAGL